MDNKVRYVEMTPEEKRKIDRKKTINYYFKVILGSIIYAFGVSWILLLCGFYSGGATGISQLIVGLFGKYGNNEDVANFLSNNLGTFVMLINVPLLVFSWKGLSKRFALLTLVSIITQTIFLNLISAFTISPFVYLINNSKEMLEAINNGTAGVGGGIFDTIKSGSFRFFKGINEVVPEVAEFGNSMLPGTRLMLAIFGGIVTGYGAALCLKYGGSTGGMDIIANYLQVKRKVSFTKISALVDGVIIALSGIFSVENVLYTLIRLIAYTKTIDLTYNAYKINRIEIITSKEKENEMRDTLLANIHHGMTIYTCIGGFTGLEKTSIVIYASRFEIPKYTEIVRSVDKDAFITVAKVDIKRGNYIQSTIA